MREDVDTEEGDAHRRREDGFLFYVRFQHAGAADSPTWPDSSGYRTVAGAMAAAERRVPSPILWVRPLHGGSGGSSRRR